MSLPVSVSVPDLAMTIPTGFAAALGIWFATTTAILLAETGLARRIAKFRLFSTWQAFPVTEVRAALRLEQQRVTPRQRRGAGPADRQRASGFQISRILLRIAAFAFGLGVALPTLAQTISGSSLNITGQSTLQGDVVTCSGHPWIDVRCNGAVGDGNHDDTNAINSTISTALANNLPVRLTAGTYKVTSRIIIDYATQAGQGFRLISDGAVIDGRTIASGPVLQIQCGNGTSSSPTGCFYFREEGTLFVNGNTPAYVVVVGKTDFSDAHNSAKFDHLIVNNTNTAPAGGGCQFNYVLDSDVYAVCVAAGGAAQAEQPAERVRLVAGAEQTAALQLGDQAFGDVFQVVRQCGRTQPEAGQPDALPVLQQVGQAGGRTGVDAGVAAVLGPGALVQAPLPGDGGGLGLVEEDDQVTEHVHGLGGAAGAGLPGPDLRHDVRGVGRVARGDEPDVGRTGD